MLIFESVMEKTHLYKVDNFGVKNYNFLVLTCFLFLVMACLTLSLGHITYIFEIENANSPVKTYGDAIWLMVMSASTIGFGDVYPITTMGRIAVYTMFLLGVGTLGTLGAIFANRIFGFADTNIKNRELRKQNADIYAKLLELEKKIDEINKP
ncbi:potassium channel family protein [Pseudocolwellia agarivorans]|uniref:potassium channel family protein n=1 Tax=Pseudocolwellia agarivorans TaxID=1911682 RepID=UPI001FEB44EE|nr:potassium channel family protein [Pseudocolwellia agarivorans]